LRDELSALQEVKSQASGDDIIPSANSDAELAAWVNGALVKRWPKDDAAQLNLLAVRLSWGSPVEPEFLSMLKKVKRPALHANVPPIASENYFVECCEGSEMYVACEGFGHVRRSKNKDPRVLKAAIKWLEESASPNTATKRLNDIRSCGLVGDILWYLADLTGDRTLTEHWTEPKLPDMAAAKQVAQSLLHSRSIIIPTGESG